MTAAIGQLCYRFGSFELQPGERRLLSAGKPVAIRGLALDVLIALVERSGHLVSKDELLGQVWGKVVVEENTLQAHISSLRKILGNEAITTVSGRGYRFVAPVTRSDAASPRRKHNLPHALTSFIGREKEIAEVRKLLEAARLLTLTGSGGCGKTRLALQLGAQVAESYPDGVWLIELAALSDPTLVPQAIAKVFELKERQGKTLTETLCAHLASRHLLLILDNAEHLLDACAEIAEVLLRRCGGLAIVCTSQAPIRITGEQTYRVPSLAVPDARRDTAPEQIAPCESVRLFVERARLQRQDFAVTAGNAAALASICRRLDGIALAIELAVPRVRSMSMQELCARLDQRFSVLTEGSRTALPRHRTLRALIDWSYELLGEDEKALLRGLSIFSGGCTLQAAERVCGFNGATLDLLTKLCDKNLVAVETRSDATRFALLETVRHYAGERLRDSGDETQVRRRHAECFVALADAAHRHELEKEAPAWLERLDADYDNLRAALRACCADRSRAGDDAVRLAGFLGWYWFARGYWSEARELTSLALASPSDAHDEAARARALRSLAGICQLQGDLAGARPPYEQSLEIETRRGNRSLIAVTLYNLANVSWFEGKSHEAVELVGQALAVAREVRDTSMVAFLASHFGVLLLYLGDFQAARVRSDEALAIWRATDHWRMGYPLETLAHIALAEKDLRTARSLAEDALIQHRRADHRAGLPNRLATLARIALASDDTQRAVSLLGEAVTVCRELENPGLLDEHLQVCGVAALALRGPIVAAHIWGSAERRSADYGRDRLINLPARAWLDERVAAARSTLGDDAAFDRAWEEGRVMDLEQAVEYALAAITAKPRDGGPG